MNYAPVVIPTLNRYEHLKQCLESFEKCTGAEYTDVYIGLDFPPSDKYVFGWKKVDAYLHQKELQNGFHKLVVFRRETNLGVTSADSNITRLYATVSQFSDTYIYLEDDNVVSPNFLEYINKGLERYKDDESVFAIVGYAHPYHFKYGDNNHYRHNTDMSAWGYGTWFKRYNQIRDYTRNGGFLKDFSISNMFKFRHHGWLRLFDFIHYAYHKGYVLQSDGLMSAYLILHDNYVITPTLSKVRNIGWDRSGNSFKHGMQGLEEIAERHNSQMIDDAEHFEYMGDDTTYMDYNNHIAAIESDGYMSFGQFLAKLWTSLFRVR